MSEENKPEQPAPGKDPVADKTPKPGPSAGGEAGEAKPKAPPKRPVKKGPSYEELPDDPLAVNLQTRFPGAVLSSRSFLDQRIYTVSLDALSDLMLYLKETPEWTFDYLVDLTALDYIGDEKRFCLVYHLYSHRSGQLIRIKVRLAENEAAPSMCTLWQVADWLEREIFDMFGIEFAGHPNLTRILLPEDWRGYPLRKDYDIKLQDQTWIRKHLRIRKVPE